MWLIDLSLATVDFRSDCSQMTYRYNIWEQTLCWCSRSYLAAKGIDYRLKTTMTVINLAVPTITDHCTHRIKKRNYVYMNSCIDSFFHYVSVHCDWTLVWHIIGPEIIRIGVLQHEFPVIIHNIQMCTTWLHWAANMYRDRLHWENQLGLLNVASDH